MERIFTDGTDPRFVILCEKLDQFLSSMNGEEKQKQVYNQYNTLTDIHDVILIMEDGTPIGCGSFKKYDNYAVEIKRVYVADEYRKKGIGRIIMNELEDAAKSKGYTKLMLETGAAFTGANNLYRSLGFQLIDNYGQYIDMKDSVCMEKII
jgi:GNAT superfamily N-acetyltransferase